MMSDVAGAAPSFLLSALVMADDDVPNGAPSRTLSEAPGSKEKALKLHARSRHEILNEPEHPQVRLTWRHGLIGASKRTARPARGTAKLPTLSPVSSPDRTRRGCRWRDPSSNRID
jgi:hypothetical protein